MDLATSRCYAQVDLEAIAENRRILREGIPNSSRLMYILKADAYGHGAVPVANYLEADAREDWIGVACLSEALELRRAGITREILILGFTPPEFAATLAEQNVTQALVSPDYVAQLSQEAQRAGVQVPCHMAVDTGMTRIGYLYGVGDPAQELEAVAAAYRTPGLRITGIFTHFSSAYSLAQEDVEFTRLQYERFAAVCQGLREMGIDPGLRHCCNSGATLLYPEYAMDMVRPGIMTYGLNPSPDTQGVLDLEPMLRLYTTVSQIRSFPAGVDVSYGRTYRTSGPRRLAVLSIGYADGLLRSLSGKAAFLLRGRLAPVVGRICMDMCMVDVTDIPEAREGDTVAVISPQRPCEILAEQMGTISYEVLCGINKRIPRIYLQGGKASEILQYIV